MTGLSHPAMAPGWNGHDLQGMYTTTAPRVRDEPAAYGPHEVDGDPFPAARVLDDLRDASDEEIPRILARYAALRSWCMRAEGAEPVLLRHAEQAARRYLSATAGPEADALARLAERAPGLDAFEVAASAAAEDEHAEGVYALLHAGYIEARRRADLARAARLAAAIAAHLEQEKADGVALWARRAERLRRHIDSG